jgi:hypothetical protein
MFPSGIQFEEAIRLHFFSPFSRADVRVKDVTELHVPAA